MCGIAGYIHHNKTLEHDALLKIGSAMTMPLTHRGPDDAGHWADSENGIVCGQRRLAIIDLSPEGHQPMISADGRFVIVFNGEIYNFQTLRKDLEALHSFKGQSDTEVLLAAIQHWGLEKTLQSIYGMFAFALWDKKNKTMSFARDHLGKKPLYFGHTKDGLAFASELKAIAALPDFKKDINKDALSLFMRHNYIPAPWSIYQGIFKLLPGSYVTLDINAEMPKDKDLLARVKRYWSAYETAHKAQNAPYQGGYEQATDDLDALLQTAVRERMVSDVPLGAFLSGGIDSSLITAMMQAQSKTPVKTFSIGFEEAAFNETDHAQAVADHLGTDHTTFMVTPKETRDVIPQLADVYDEPFADMSQIPTMHVCRLARQEATVALSGDGGDESFAGYERYQWAQTMAEKVMRYTALLRLPAAHLITALPVSAWDILLSPLRGILKKAVGRELNGHRLHIASSFLKSKTFDDLYLQIMSHWKNPNQIVIGGHESISPMTDPAFKAAFKEAIHNAMISDTMAYLPDDILVKVDRASMAYSLEVRAPLLDKNVIEWAWSLPLEFKYQNGNSKRILKDVLNRYVPQSITDRPKQGFGVPMAVWLRGPLKDWASELLSEKALQDTGLFEPSAIAALWQEHLAEKRDWNYYLWDVLMAQAWAKRWL